MSWLTTEPPNDGSPFLADLGYPWPVFAAWNGCDFCFVVAELNINRVDGVYNDPYFETSYEKPTDIKRWMPLPELPLT